MLVNCKGEKAPKTNVARDGLEHSEEQKDLLRFIYNSYIEIAGEQISHLSEKYSLSWALDEAQRNIDNIARQRNYQDKELFDEVLHDYKCNLVDTGEKYINQSIRDFGEEIWTIESNAYSSAEKLVQEIKNCDKTALSLFQSLDSSFNNNKRNIFSETSAKKHTIDIFLKEYEVSEIQVFENNRRFEFCWNKGNARWKLIKGDSPYIYRSFPNMYIIRNLSDVKININNYDIIVSRYGLFFISDHPLRNFLLSVLDNTDINKIHAVEIIAGYIYYLNNKRNKHTDENFKKYFNSNENFFRDDIWEYLDKDTLNNALNSSLSFLDFRKYYSQQN